MTQQMIKMSLGKTLFFAVFVLLLELYTIKAQLFANVELDAGILKKLKGNTDKEGIIWPDLSKEVKMTEDEPITHGAPLPSDSTMVAEVAPLQEADAEPTSVEEISHTIPPEEKSLPIPSPIPAPPQAKPVPNNIKEDPFKPNTQEQDIRSLIDQFMISGGDPKSSVSKLEQSLGIPPGALLKNTKNKGNDREYQNQKNQDATDRKNHQRPDNHRQSERIDERHPNNGPSNFRNGNDRPNRGRDFDNNNFRPNNRRHSNSLRQSSSRESNRNPRNRQEEDGFERNREEDQFSSNSQSSRNDRQPHSRGRDMSNNRNRNNRRQNSHSMEDSHNSGDFGPGKNFDKLFEEAERKYSNHDRSHSRSRNQNPRNLASSQVSNQGPSQVNSNSNRSHYPDEDFEDTSRHMPEAKEWTGNHTRERQQNGSPRNSRNRHNSQQNNRSNGYDYDNDNNYDNNEKHDFNMNSNEPSNKRSRDNKYKQTRSRKSKKELEEDNFGGDKDFESFFNSNFDKDFDFDMDNYYRPDGQGIKQRNENYKPSDSRRTLPESSASQRQPRTSNRDSRNRGSQAQSYDQQPPQPRRSSQSRTSSERPIHSRTRSRDELSNHRDGENRYDSRESSRSTTRNNPDNRNLKAGQYYRRSGDPDTEPRKERKVSPSTGYDSRARDQRPGPQPPAGPVYPPESDNTYEPTDIDPLAYHEESPDYRTNQYKASANSASSYSGGENDQLTFKQTARDASYETTDIDPLAYHTTLTDKPNSSPPSRKSENQYYNTKDNGPKHAPNSQRPQSFDMKSTAQQSISSDNAMFAGNEHDNIPQENGNFNDRMSPGQGSSHRDYVLPEGRELKSRTKEISAATDEAEQQCLQMTRRHGGNMESSRLERTCASFRQWGEDMVNGNVWTPTAMIQRWWQSLTTPETVTSAALNDAPRAMKIANDTNSNSRRKRSLNLQFGTLRKEYRMMRHEERQAFHKAVNTLKSETIDGVSKYDIFVHFHHPYYAPGAYFGPAFFGWHREYLLRFERALQAVDPSVFLPYWDSSIDGLLGDQASDSIMWMETFAGNAFGRVVTGPFAEWSAQTAAGKSTLQRNLGWKGQLTMDETDHKPVQDETVNKIMFAKSHQSLTWFVDPSVEADIQGTLRWVSGSMADLTYAPSDPLFFMHYAFIDCIWEQSRLRKLTEQARFNFRADYPNDTVSLGFGMLRPDGRMVSKISQSFHAALNEMEPFGPLLNIAGVDGDYSRIYACAPRPMCTKKYPHCNSPYLFCNKGSWLCVPKLQLSTDCSKFKDLSPCYNAQCCEVHGTYQCRERCEDVNFRLHNSARSHRQRRRRPHVIT